MKISFNWLQDYVQSELDVHQTARVLTSTGLEVEKVEAFESVKGGLRGVVIGLVTECTQHPNADRLRLTRVDIGTGEPLSIVCGAPNVAAGQKVLVATIGTTLYPTSGEPLTIKKGKIRGEESHGMICAEDELGLGTSHDGILVLDNDAPVGSDAASYLGISQDHSLEIGLTPNRTDAMSHYGVARDFYAAVCNMDGLPDSAISISRPTEVPSALPVTAQALPVEVLSEAACPRYAGVLITGIRVGESPAWLQDRLKAIGLKPINNVVDITNYVQHDLGQPLHAFDADKIAGPQVIVRLAREGEKFTTLDGIERTLNAADLMICDAEKPMCIAGVFGGLHSGVSETTTSVFLESAYFDPVFIRKTARRHGLNTDASFRFERGVDPEITLTALHKAVNLMAEIAGASAISPVADICAAPIAATELNFKWKTLNKLTGYKIPARRVISILTDLGITVVEETEDGLLLSIPPFKTDVKREADVVEEILRIYGYDNIPMPAHMKLSVSATPDPDPEKIQYRIADLLTSRGFSEMMSMSLTSEKYVSENEGGLQPVRLLNPLSSDLAVMRETMLHSGLEAIALNQNHKNADLRLYEFGKTYHKKDGAYLERRHLALFLTGRRLPENWNNDKADVGFADLNAAVDAIVQVLGISATFDYPGGKAEVFSGRRKIGELLPVDAATLRKADVRQQVWFADLDWDAVLASVGTTHIRYAAPMKYPAVRRDLSLLLDKSVSYSLLEKTAYEAERKLLRSVGLFDVYEGDKLEAGKKSYALSFILQDAGKTLTDDQVDKAMGRIMQALVEKTGAALRQAQGPSMGQ